MRPPLPPSRPRHRSRPTTCDRHPEVQLVGICPKCLYQRLVMLLRISSSSSISARIVVATTEKPKFFRSNSFPPSRYGGLYHAFEKLQRESCKVETRNFVSSSIVQEDEEDSFRIHNEIVEVEEPQPKPQVAKIEYMVQEITEEEPKGELSVGAKKNLKGCFGFATSILKKLRKLREEQMVKKHQ